MKMYKCDRCGQIFGLKSWSEVKIPHLPHKTYGTSYDLCPECMDELVEFLESKESHKEN